MPRPTKLTDDVQKRVLDALRSGNYMETAARYAGIDESTLHRWIARGKEDDAEEPYREFCKSVERARAEAEVRNLHLIQSAAQGGTWQAAAWFLERSFPGRWGRREKVEMSGPDGGPITLKGLADLMGVSDEE
jgi:transposase-like protein